MHPTGPSTKRIKLFGVELDIEIEEPIDSVSNKVNDDVAVVNDDVSQALNRISEIDASVNVYRNVGKDLSCLLSRAEKGDELELSKRHLNLFTSLSCGNALCELYLSNLDHNKKIGEALIKQFVTGVDWFNDGLRIYAAPVVILFCKRLRVEEASKELYYNCWFTLGRIFHTMKYKEPFVSELRRLVDWKEIFPFMIEYGEQLLDLLGKILEWNLPGIVKFEGGYGFSSFVSVVVDGILESLKLVGQIRMPYGVLVNPLCEQLQSLYRLFCQLRDKWGLCLTRADQCLGVEHGEPDTIVGFSLEYLGLSKALHEISKIYTGAGESIMTMLEMGKASFSSLVMGIEFEDLVAEDDGNGWVFYYKDILSFEARWHLACSFFPYYMADLDDDNISGLEIKVHRSSLLADSCKFVAQANPGSLQYGLSIQFVNEVATGDGVLREWLAMVCKELFNTQNALFCTSPNDHRRFFINPASVVQPEHLDYFRLCGIVIALALMNRVQVGVSFDHVLFNQLAGFDVQLEDIIDTDPVFYRSCRHVLDMDADLVDSDHLGLTFLIEFEEFGSRRVVELYPGGEGIKVNSTNRAQYVNELIRHRFVAPTSNQVAHLSDGFRNMMYKKDMQLFFRCLTLEDINRMLLGSESDISVADWKAHTFYDGYKSTSREISWFWKIVEELSPEKRRLLLFFWTTVKYLPFDGFSGLPYRLDICKVAGTADHLPSSNTCFYQLCLPRYPTFNIMKQRIEVIVDEHMANSFGKN